MEKLKSLQNLRDFVEDNTKVNGVVSFDIVDACELRSLMADIKEDVDRLMSGRKSNNSPAVPTTPPHKEAQEDLVRLKSDRVNHPSHYTWLKNFCGIEVIDITRHMDFNLGNSIKYILRSGHKSEEGMSDKAKQIEDLQKAIFYLNDEIKRLQK